MDGPLSKIFSLTVNSLYSASRPLGRERDGHQDAHLAALPRGCQNPQLAGAVQFNSPHC